MKRFFSAVLLWTAMLTAGLTAEAMPDHLYLIGHGQGSESWKVNSTLPEGRKVENQKMFVFENVSLGDGWDMNGSRVGSFGFIVDLNNSGTNPSPNYYGHSDSSDKDLTGNDAITKYLPIVNNAAKGFVVKKGIYTLTVDFTNENNPTLSLCSPDQITPGGSQEDIEYNGNFPDFKLRIEKNGWGELRSFNRNGNEYSIDVSAYEIIGNGVSRFKISTMDNEWSSNFGYSGDTSELTIPFAVKGEFRGDGNNPECQENWGDFTIKFWYKGDGEDKAPILYFLPRNYTGELPNVSVPKPAGITGTLPVLYINVYTDANKTVFNNEVIDYNLDHKNYFSNADYWLEMNGVDWMDGAEDIGSREAPLPLEIKARGNWTRQGFVKKPFKLKLGDKQSMLGLSKSKHFAILAHADDDKGYLRNYIGFNLGKRIGLPWTPSQQPVEVVINGDYRGLYFLTESIRVEKDRINIEELEDNADDMAQVTGGYVIEFDNYSDESVWARTDGNAVWHDNHNFPVYLTPDTPETYSDVQRTFIHEQFNKMHDLVGAHNSGLWSYLDLDDAVRYYLVEELISHYEAYHGSTYLFRDGGEDQKWHFSPLWDCGHAFEGGTENYFYDSQNSMGNTWIRCMKDTREFDEKLKATFKWFMSSEYNGLMNDIDEYCNIIAEAAKSDHARWGNAGVPNTTWTPTVVQDNSNMNSKKEFVKNYLNAKIEWLKGQWGDFSDRIYPEPERDTTPAAELDQKYKDALPKEYVWHDSFNTTVEDTHGEGEICLGNLATEEARANINLDKTEFSFPVDERVWGDNPEPSVRLAENGDIMLTAPVPAIYNVILTMKEHKEGDKTFKKTTINRQVTVKPTFRNFIMGKNCEMDLDRNVITVWTGEPWGIKLWSPFGGDPYADIAGFDELYYRVHYADGRRSAPAKAESAYPYDMTKYDSATGIDLNYADGLEMAVKVNGATSDKQDFTFSFAGGSIVTGIDGVEADGEDVSVRYFDLSGVEIKAPTEAGVYIRVADGKASKITVR